MLKDGGVWDSFGMHVDIEDFFEWKCEVELGWGESDISLSLGVEFVFESLLISTFLLGLSL